MNSRSRLILWKTIIRVYCLPFFKVITTPYIIMLQSEKEKKTFHSLCLSLNRVGRLSRANEKSFLRFINSFSNGKVYFAVKRRKKCYYLKREERKREREVDSYSVVREMYSKVALLQKHDSFFFLQQRRQQLRLHLWHGWYRLSVCATEESGMAHTHSQHRRMEESHNRLLLHPTTWMDLVPFVPLLLLHNLTTSFLYRATFSLKPYFIFFLYLFLRLSTNWSPSRFFSHLFFNCISVETFFLYLPMDWGLNLNDSAAT